MSDLHEAAKLRRVWCAVIHTAIDDACRKPTRSNAHRRADAIAWLTEPNDDFNVVCYLAGLEHDSVRLKAKELIEQAQGNHPITNGAPYQRGAKRRERHARYDHAGRSLTLKQWSELLDIGVGTLRARIIDGWSLERVFGQRKRTKAPSVRLATPMPTDTPGVARDFGEPAGTGVGSATRDSAEIEFSQSTEPAE